jgi:hypothetical protein
MIRTGCSFNRWKFSSKEQQSQPPESHLSGRKETETYLKGMPFRNTRTRVRSAVEKNYPVSGDVRLGLDAGCSIKPAKKNKDRNIYFDAPGCVIQRG